MDQLSFVFGFLDVAITVVVLGIQSWVAATVARRVLGVPVGWPRTIAVGVLMTTTLGVAVRYLFTAGGVGNEAGLNVAPLIAVMFALLAVLWIFALGVALLMVLEIVMPTGSVPHPFLWFKSWKERRAKVRRYTEVVGIAAKHGLASRFRGLGRRTSSGSEQQTARALRCALNEAGVTFIKLGQMLSTRRDLLPESYIRELSELQNNATPEPWERIRGAIESSLGKPIAEVFAHLDPEPLAAASVAQVHAATLLDGTGVVVKVQRPGALAQVQLDVVIIRQLAGWLQRAAPWAKRLNATALAGGFAASLAEELDYRVEVDNMRAVQLALGRTEVRVPIVYREHSSTRLLVMERLKGVPVSAAAPQLQALGQERRSELAKLLLKATLRQITTDGVFHADLHPGNIFIEPDGGLALLDFGAVGRLDPGSQRALGLLLYAIDQNDEQLTADSLVQLLDRPAGLQERQLERSLGQLLVRYRHGFGSGSSADMFTSLFQLIVVHGFSVPPQVAAAFRALGALEGTLGLIDPQLDIVAESRAEGKKLIGRQFEPANLRDELEAKAMTLLPVLAQLPRRINKIAEDLEQGRFTANVRVLGHREDRRFVTRMVQQLIVAILAAAATIGAIMLITNDSGPLLTEQVRVHAFFGYTLLFAGFVLGLRAVTLVFGRNSKEDEDDG